MTAPNDFRERPVRTSLDEQFHNFSIWPFRFGRRHDQRHCWQRCTGAAREPSFHCGPPLASITSAAKRAPTPGGRAHFS